jgi:hypothetical protein
MCSKGYIGEVRDTRRYHVWAAVLTDVEAAWVVGAIRKDDCFAYVKEPLTKSLRMLETRSTIGSSAQIADWPTTARSTQQPRLGGRCTEGEVTDGWRVHLKACRSPGPWWRGCQRAAATFGGLAILRDRGLHGSRPSTDANSAGPADRRIACRACRGRADA